jgi:tetratricopeptide (TPR) repeat protein
MRADVGAFMAEIFVSHNSSDRDWAEWIGKELRALGHEPHLDAWEIEKGESIYAWMERVHDKADHVLCVVSDAYLDRVKAPYSALERDAALWQSVNKRPGFTLIVVVKPTTIPTLSDHLRRCELFNKPEAQARADFRDFMRKRNEPPSVAFPGKVFAHSNISIRPPEHFLGRDDAMAALEAALARVEGRVAITALHGLRGVGKTVLAVAYAEKHRTDYRATWWLRAETEATLRADLVGLGVRLQWVEADAKEEAAVEAVLERLRHEGGGILLIYDNAIDADSLRPLLPKGGAAKVIVTSNAPNWRAVAAPIEIEVWPKEIGADFLIARTDRTEERADAEALSVALGGLPLAHEQAAAYCETLDVGFMEYLKRFEAEPIAHLADAEFTPQEHNDRQTVARSFALAIEEAGKKHPLAEPLIRHAALLAPEPIPLFFLEGLLSQPSWPAPGLDPGAGHDVSDSATSEVRVALEKAIAALRRFALVDLEEIADERDATLKTKCLRLHRLVRFVAGVSPPSRSGGGLGRGQSAPLDEMRSALIQAMVAVYPDEVYDDPKGWPRARRLDALALPLVEDGAPPAGAEESAIFLLDRLASYRQGALGAYRRALPLFQQALTLAERHYPPEHAEIAEQLSNLGALLRDLGGAENLAAARAQLTRALAISEKALGPDHPVVAVRLSVLALVLQALGGEINLNHARDSLMRAVSIGERALAGDHPDLAVWLSNLAMVLQDLGGPQNLEAARAHLSLALAINEKALGPEHPKVAIGLCNLAVALADLGGEENLETARKYLSRAILINEKALGPEHPAFARDLSNLATVLQDLGGRENLETASAYLSRALAIDEKVLGPEHPKVAIRLSNLAGVLQDLGGPENLLAARHSYRRAETILGAALGPEHPYTQKAIANFAAFREKHGDA